MSKQIVFVGQKYYAIKKLSEYRRQGYSVVRTTEWSDGSTTYVMEKQ